MSDTRILRRFNSGSCILLYKRIIIIILLIYLFIYLLNAIGSHWIVTKMAVTTSEATPEYKLLNLKEKKIIN